MSRGAIGWDIGGINTKVAHVAHGHVLWAGSRPFELQRDPSALAPLLHGLARLAGADAAVPHGVTMTAELSQMFRTKREGVAFVLDALEYAFPASPLRVYAVDGRFLSTGEAREAPLKVAASNWSATARAMAAGHRDALLIDIGTTTTDIIPVVGGLVVAQGWTDPDRLASGELVYTGALRTPTEAIASRVPLGQGLAGTSAEGFALAGDVHLWRGALSPDDYSVPTPDGRPVTRAFAAERLARVVCADRDALDDAAVSAIADALARAQVKRIAAAVVRVIARHPSLRHAVVCGIGAFLGEAAAREAGLEVLPLAADLGETAARVAPAASVAILLEQSLAATPAAPAGLGDRKPASFARVSRGETPLAAVVKVGGALLAHPDSFAAALAAIRTAALHERLLVVPGGGPFADVVREIDARYRLSDSGAHWMAIAAMDQYARLIAEKLLNAVLVSDAAEIGAVIDAGRVPVLAPLRWLREADPLPHSWDVTSDSIAAWIAGQLGAGRLVLVKPPGAAGPALVDRRFSQSLPAHVTSVIVAADEVDALATALRGKAAIVSGPT